MIYDIKNFGFWLRELRESKALSRKDLCSRAGISSSYYANFENHCYVPGPAVVDRLCSIFGVTEMEFYFQMGRIPAPMADWILKNPGLREFIIREFKAGAVNTKAGKLKIEHRDLEPSAPKRGRPFKEEPKKTVSRTAFNSLNNRYIRAKKQLLEQHNLLFDMQAKIDRLSAQLTAENIEIKPPPRVDRSKAVRPMKTGESVNLGPDGDLSPLAHDAQNWAFSRFSMQGFGE